MIKGIAFDVGNVIVPFYSSCLWRYLKKHSNKNENLFALEHIVKYGTGKYSSEEFYEEFSKHLGLDFGFERFVQVMNNYFGKNMEMENLVSVLSKNYETFLLSNSNEIHWNFLLENYSILRNVPTRIASHEVGHRKPHDKIYKTLWQKTNLKWKEIIFIDDLKENVIASEWNGFIGIHYKNVKQLKKELKNYNLKLR